MKLLAITCIAEIRADMIALLKKSGATALSETAITGHKLLGEGHHTDEWFASGGETYDSVLLFSFCEAAVANACIDALADYLDSNKTPFPPKMAILQVEKALF